MGKKRKIKRRKDKISSYNVKYKDIPKNDPVERIMHCIGDKLTIKKVQEIIEKKNNIQKNLTYSHVKLTFYEEPAGSERPRSRLFGGNIMSYVPNAKDNKEYLRTFIKKLKKDIKFMIHTPIYIVCKSYHPMPENAPIDEQVLFEAGIMDGPITKPDFDNMIKTYTDMLIEIVILDDDLIYKANIQKFFSFLPRVELYIYYQDAFTSKYLYNKIKSRKSFKRIKDSIELAKLLI